MSSLRISLDEADVANVVAQLEQLKESVRAAALSRALNRTATGLRAEATRRVGQVLPRLRATVIRRAFAIDEATPAKLHADVDVAKVPFLLSEFATSGPSVSKTTRRKQGRGEVVPVGVHVKHPKTLTGAFWVTGRNSGKKVLVERRSRGAVDDGGRAHHRHTKTLYTTGVYDVFKDNLEAVREHSRERLLKEIASQIEFRRSKGQTV